MANLPADIINQALDAAGVDIVIGDPEEGTREAQVCLRAYVECVRQLLQAAHWDFARKQAPLDLLASSLRGEENGNFTNPDIGSFEPNTNPNDNNFFTPNIGFRVPFPWVYEYSYPTDCLKVRYVPWNNHLNNNEFPGNRSIPNTPLVTGFIGSPATTHIRIMPAPFLVTMDYNYPVDTNVADGQWWEIPGASPIGRKVILSNVRRAHGVYTAYVPYPNMWDPLFRAALVSYLASEIALPLGKDKKFALTIRGQLIATVKNKLELARITNGNEGFSTTDHYPDWLKRRYTGGWGNGWGGGDGGIGLGSGGGIGGFDSCGFADGSAY